MKKKAYQEPTILIVKLLPHCSVLSVSPQTTTNGEDFTWEEE